MVSLKRHANVDMYYYDRSDSENDDEDSESSLDKISTEIAKAQGKPYCSSNLNTFQNLNEPYDSGRLNFSRKRKLSVDSEIGCKKRNSFSKNALMAREHRQKKKLYMQNLETAVDKYKDENKKLTSILDNQSTLIADLRREVKYLKSVLANSTDISLLLKNINRNTGLPVSTSLNTNLRQTDASVSELCSYDPGLKLDGVLNELCDDFPIFDDVACNDTDDMLDSLVDQNKHISGGAADAAECNDHDYSRDCREDFGVCLHIARRKVSLEFCSSCSENATAAWDNC